MKIDNVNNCSNQKMKISKYPSWLCQYKIKKLAKQDKKRKRKEMKRLKKEKKVKLNKKKSRGKKK